MTELLAYGSLMWDNALATYRGEPVAVDGHRRAFVGRCTRRWGTARHPCPQIGLVPCDAGDGCQAVLFEIPSPGQRRLIRNLRRREGVRPRAIRVRDGAGRVRRARYLPAPADAEGWDLEEATDALRRARGVVGTGTEYVRTLVHAMELWGIDDPLIRRVWGELRPDPSAKAGARV